MHTKSNNMQIMMVKETNETNTELFGLFGSLLQIYHEGFEEKLRGSNFILFFWKFWVIAL